MKWLTREVAEGGELFLSSFIRILSCGSNCSEMGPETELLQHHKLVFPDKIRRDIQNHLHLRYFLRSFFLVLNFAHMNTHVRTTSACDDRPFSFVKVKSNDKSGGKTKTT
jgi:hypothetical protein